VNPAIGKDLLASSLGSGWLRVFVQSLTNANPIPDGPLYTCTVRAAPSALPSTYILSSESVSAFAPTGAMLPYVEGADGSIRVSLVPQTCPGDCDGNRQVRVEELVKGIQIDLGDQSLQTCFPFDVDGNGTVTVDELAQGVNAALKGCGF